MKAPSQVMTQALVKFMGKSDDRLPLTTPIIEVIDGSACRGAVAYPCGRRPRSVEDGAVIYVSRQTTGPNDQIIFGRAIGEQHVPGRDDATPEEIRRHPWKQRWCHYIRIHQVEFLAGTLANGVSLFELMDALGSDSSSTTQEHARRGSGNTNPRKSIRQQPDVKLSPDGHEWLAKRLQAAFDVHGKITQGELDALN